VLDKCAVESAHEEMAGQPHAMERQPDPPADLQGDDRQADREADSAFDDPVQEAVVRVVVLGRRGASEARLGVQDVVQPVEHRPTRVTPVEPDPRPLRQGLQRVQRRLEPQLGPLVGRDEERTLGQIDVRFGPRGQARESGHVGGAGVVDRGHGRDATARACAILAPQSRGSWSEISQR
jgi:hypothetical protein